MAEHANITSAPTPSPSRRSAIRGGLVAFAAAASGVGVTAAASVPTEPDAELIELGRRLIVEWRRVDDCCTTNTGISDEELDDLMAPSNAIVDRIEHLPAHTFEGLQAKAIAVSWCCDGEEIGPHHFCPYESAATDERIAASIVRDLLRVQGRHTAVEANPV